MLLDRTVFRMYIKDGCPFCDKAKDVILNDLNSSLHTVDVSEEPEIHELIIKETGHRTVPAVYLGTEFIGGCDDLVERSQSTDFRINVLREEVSILRSEVIRLRRSI
jgi:glutaredoxin 3|tara:strand:+ start:230 stop:550 length:321 start_codon:yes stop_codon:yes gene_type:complete